MHKTFRQRPILGVAWRTCLPASPKKRRTHTPIMAKGCITKRSSASGRCRSFFVLWLLLLTLLAACGAESNASGITITGSTSVAPFAEHLAETYQREHVGATVNVQSLGSTAGIQAALQGVAEIGMSSRDLKPAEAEKLDQLVIARDALAVIVHPSNVLDNLTQAQVQEIFSGRVRSWAELGGPPRPIVLVIREAGSGTFGAFEELVMQGVPLTPAALRQGSNGAIRQVVSGDPYAIGYISLGIVDATVKPVAINGIEPSVENVEAGKYTFVRPFLFVWRKGEPPGPLASSYINFVMSEEGQQTLANLGLIRGEKRP